MRERKGRVRPGTGAKGKSNELKSKERNALPRYPSSFRRYPIPTRNPKVPSVCSGDPGKAL